MGRELENGTFMNYFPEDENKFYKETEHVLQDHFIFVSKVQAWTKIHNAKKKNKRKRITIIEKNGRTMKFISL